MNAHLRCAIRGDNGMPGAGMIGGNDGVVVVSRVAEILEGIKARLEAETRWRDEIGAGGPRRGNRRRRKSIQLKEE